MKKFDRTRVVSVLVHQRGNNVESMKSVKKGWDAFFFDQKRRRLY